jgi:hypothetical protein
VSLDLHIGLRLTRGELPYVEVKIAARFYRRLPEILLDSSQGKFYTWLVGGACMKNRIMRIRFVAICALLLCAVAFTTHADPIAVPNRNESGPLATPTPTATPCASVGSWTEQAPYPIALSGHAVVSQGGNLYSFGGIVNNMAIASAYMYSPAANTWTPIASLPAPRAWFSGASDGTYIYLLGGVDQNFTTTATLWRYDPAYNTYNTSLPPYTIPTYFHASAYLNGKIYRIAGAAIGTDFHVEVYDIATNSWSMAANYPFANHTLMAAALGGFIYAGGGNASPDKTYRYDPNTNTWDDAAVADLPAGRSAAASGVYNGRWLLAGGDVNFVTSNSVIAWDPATNTWTDLANMVQARDYLEGATVGQSFYAVAGNSGVGTPTNDNQQYTEIPCGTPTPTPTSTPTATPTATATATATPTATATATSTPTPTPTPTPTGAPAVTTNPATNMASFSATLNGTVNPHGSTTSVHFQYGTTTNYGSVTANQSFSGTTTQNVAANISGLTANTTYHFRIVATNGHGTSYGSDRAFTTLTPTGPPVVRTNPATNVATHSATLNGTVDPHGLSTTVSFQYGRTTSYGSTTANQTKTGNSYQNVSANISGLTANATYHFRIKATNSGGTRYGSDRTFTTLH